MPSLATSLRNELSSNKKFRGCTHYIGVLSRSPELVALGANAVDAEKVCVLYDGSLPDEKVFLEQTLRDRIGKDNVQFVPIAFAEPIRSVIKAVERFAGDAADPTKVVLDVKPATKKLSYALLKAAKPQYRILCIQEKDNGPNDRRPVPGEEVLEFLDEAL